MSSNDLHIRSAWKLPVASSVWPKFECGFLTRSSPALMLISCAKHVCLQCKTSSSLVSKVFVSSEIKALSSIWKLV